MQRTWVQITPPLSRSFVIQPREIQKGKKKSLQMKLQKVIAQRTSSIQNLNNIIHLNPPLHKAKIYKGEQTLLTFYFTS